MKHFDGIYRQITVTLTKPENKRRLTLGTVILVIIAIIVSLVIDFFPYKNAQATVIQQYTGGLLVYADTTNVGTPKYKTFDDTTGFGAEQSASSVGASAISWIRVAASPVSDTWIIATKDAAATNVIKAQVCTGVDGGVSCGAATTIDSSGGAPGLRNFDVAYEGSTGGEAILVYGTATADNNDLYYNKYSGGSWGGATGITTNRTTGTVEWVELTTRNNSDQIGIAYSDSGDDVSAYRWSGSAVADEATAVITAVAQAGNVRKFDVSFEGTSGDMLVASPTTAGGTDACGQLVGTTWTINTTACALPDVLTDFIDLAEPGSSDYISMSSHGVAATTLSEGYAWNGTSIVDNTSGDDNLLTWGANYQETATSYFSTGTYYAVGVISNSAATDDIDYWTVNSTGAVADTATVNTRTRGAGRFRDLFDYPNADKVLLITADAGSDLWADTWAGATGGSAWTDLTPVPSPGTLEGDLASATTDVVDFAFRLAPLPPGSCSSAQTGPWATGSTWGAGCTGSGGIPAAGDSVIILNTHVVTIATGVSGVATNVTINEGGTLTVTSTGTLSASGNYLNNGTNDGTGALTLTGSSKTIDGTGSNTLTGLTTLTNDKTIQSSAVLSLSGALTISSGTTTNNGTISVAGTLTTTGNWTQGADSTLNVAGSGTNAITGAGTLTATASGNTVNYNLNNAQTCKVVTYYHLILSGGGAKTCVVTAVSGNVTVSGAATWTTGAILTITGSVTLAGTGAPAMTQGAFALTIGSLTLSGGGFTTTSTAATAFTNNGTTTINTGTLTVQASTSNKTFTGLITLNGGSLTGACATLVLGAGITNTSGSVTLTGTATMSTASGALTATTGMAIANVSVTATGQTFSGAGTITLSGTMTVNTTGTAVTNSGTLSVATMTVTAGTVLNNGTVTISGNFTGAGGWTQGGSSVLNVGGSGANAIAVTTFDASTNANNVNYSATGGGQTIRSTTYRTLTLSNTGGSTDTAGNNIVATTLNTASGGILDMATYTLGVTTINNSGTIRTQNTSGTPIPAGLTWGGTVQYDSTAGTQTVVTGTYTTLAFANTGRVATMGGTVGATTLTITSGTLATSTNQLTVPGTTTVTGTLNISGAGGSAHSFGDVIISVTTGEWNNSGNADVGISGSFTNNHTFTSGSGTYTLSGGSKSLAGTLSFDGPLTVSGSYDANTSVLSVTGLTTVSGTLTFGSATGAKTFGDVTISTTTGVWNNSGNADVGISGSLTNNHTFTSGSGTYTFNGTAGVKTIASGGAAFNNIVFNGAATFRPTDDLTVNADFTLTNGVLDFDTSDPTVLIGNDSGTSNVTFDGGGITSSGSANFILNDDPTEFDDNVGITLGNVVIGQSPATTNLKSDMSATSLTIGIGDTYNTRGWEVTLTTFLDCQGTCILNTTDTAVPPNYEGNGTIITIGTNWTMSATGTYTLDTDPGTPTKNYFNGTGNQTITTGGKAFYQFEINNTGNPNDDIIISADLDINGTFTITDGELKLNTNDPTVNLAAAVSIASAGSWTKQDTGSPVPATTFDGTTAFTDSSSTGPQNIGWVIINGTSLTLGSSMTVDSMTVTAGTLDLASSGYTLTIAGSGQGASKPFANSGTLAEGTNSMVKFTGTAATDILNETYYNLTIAPASGSPTHYLINTTTVSGKLEIGDGANGVTLDSADKALDVVGAFEIKASGTFIAPSSSAFSIGGSYTNSATGTYTDSSGLLTLDGTGAQTITAGGINANHDFYKLTVTNDSASGISFADSCTVSDMFDDNTAPSKLTFHAGSTYAFTAINIDGTAGNYITMVSSSPGSQWLFNVSGSPTVSYVNVTDSDARGGSQIDATNNCIGESQNNLHWLFAVPTLSFSLYSFYGNTITFANLNSDNNWTDVKTGDYGTTVTTSTNASNGYTVKAYITQLLTSLAYPTKTIRNYDYNGASWATPTEWPSGKCDDTPGSCGFGYTSNDPLVQGSNRFADATKYAPFSLTAQYLSDEPPVDVVADSTGPVTDEPFNITYKVAVSSTQAASTYQTYAIYIVTANY